MLPAATSSDVYQPRRLARERRLATAEGHIGVTLWGPADAAPIVMLHGWMDCARGWQLLADCLPEDWPLAAIDWRGYGQSEPRVAYPASGPVVNYLTRIVGHKRAREMWSAFTPITMSSIDTSAIV